MFPVRDVPPMRACSRCSAEIRGSETFFVSEGGDVLCALHPPDGIIYPPPMSAHVEPESIRDRFAMAALQNSREDRSSHAAKYSAIHAYAIADAMLEARKR